MNDCVLTRLDHDRTGQDHHSEVKGKIINVLLKLQNRGLSEKTLKGVSYRLFNMAKYVNLDDTESVAQYIAKLQCNNSYKQTLVKAYNYYVKINNLSWNRPKYKSERKIPKIPTTEAINTIISSSSKKYAVIFKILMETGVMPYELSNVTLRDIDLENGILSVQGHKGHTSRIFKLKSETIAMLKLYLQKHNTDNPFPNSVYMGRMWRNFRNRLSEKLKNPMLRTIRLYDLRHYYGTMTYHKTKDILYTKQQMGHKKIETTLLYAQLINFESDEYTSAVAKDINEASSLIESGFEYVTTFDNLMLFRKRKIIY